MSNPYARTKRALELIRNNKVFLESSGLEIWKVDQRRVTVNTKTNEYDCNCPDHDPEKGGVNWCKHMQAVWLTKNTI